MLHRLESTSRTDQVVQQLTEAILAGELARHQPLPPERQMAETLGVSRSVVREAAKILESRGLVTVRHGVGTIVQGVTAGPMAQVWSNALRHPGNSELKLLEMRMPIETEIAALAALRRSDLDLERLNANFQAQRANRDLDVSARLDVEFHALLARATHNEMFELLLESLTAVLFDTRRRAWELSTHENVIRRHGAILTAVTERDSKKAAAAMRRHLDVAWGEALRGALPGGGLRCWLT